MLKRVAFRRVDQSETKTRRARLGPEADRVCLRAESRSFMYNYCNPQKEAPGSPRGGLMSGLRSLRALERLQTPRHLHRAGQGRAAGAQQVLHEVLRPPGI